MKSDTIARLGCLAVACGLLSGASVPQMAVGRSASGSEQLEAAFRTCVSLYGLPLAGDLMRAISNGTARGLFVAAHSEAVHSFSLEKEHGYSTATAQLNDGVTIAGVPARAIYASTCVLECPLAVWGLEFGALKAEQQRKLEAWVASAPSTHTGSHGEIKVQLNTTSDGQTLLICDASG
ncbi:MAG TPA: hypothetical protein VGM15_10380 [Burkholderiaceae bacterium]|jgi:hypothetical protein